ncbi:MAG: alpha-L-fucosidase [Phycisphaerae bacterium]|nr:alpha-L-fucosidase [Phycisphaerae bacterium]
MSLNSILKTRGLMLLYCGLMAGMVQTQASVNRTDIPKPTAPQLAWQQAELGVVFHYDLHVFDDMHYHQPTNRKVPCADINAFNPEQLDTDQWIRTARDMGARFAILTASHETGFRLWQSDVNPYSLKSVTWGNGKRDIVREFIASCKKYDLKPGIYMGTRWNSQLGIYDFKVTERSTVTQQQYNAMIEKEVAEICSRYGDLFEIWFDGGAYGPERGGPDVLSVFEKYQKHCLFYHNYDRADARWGGSESGTVPYPCWGTFPYKATGSGESTINQHVQANGFALLKHGDPNGRFWMPAMSDAPLRNHEWFWDEGDDHKLYPLTSLVNMYYHSVGRNSTLILGLTPDKRGLMPDADVARCREFGEAIRNLFRHEVAATSGQGSRVQLDLPANASFDHVVIQEDIAQGERVRQFRLERFFRGQWIELNTGSCIGHKRILRFDPVAADALRLTISESTAEPLIKNLAAYNSLPSNEDTLLKVMTWNVLYSFNHGKATEQGIHWIKDQAPDVIALQELNGNTAQSLQHMAGQWGHDHSVILKEQGFPVGLTSNRPIEVVEKQVEGFHHGYLHCKTWGIHFFVVHFWPSKPNESEWILKRIRPLLDAGEKVIVLGDFNNRSRRDSETDAHVNDPDACLITDRFEAAGFVDTTHRHDPQASYSFGSPVLIPQWAKTMADVLAKRQRIDFIFADSQLSQHSVSGTILHSDALDTISDHYPVVTVFKLPSAR